MAAIPESTLPGHKLLHERVVHALEVCHESKDIEFKSSAAWEDLKHHITKSCMAMSNLRDGGILVIGMRQDDDKWIPEGIDPVHLATYDEDDVNDSVNRHASPPMRVSLVRVLHDAITYLAISVPEFDSTPTVCARDGTNILRGQIYIRPIGKPETRLVLSAHELHDLLDAAAEKRARRFLEMAWPFPHLSRHDDRSELGESWFGAWTDWESHVEYWRLYQSAQFIHLAVVREHANPEWGAKLREAAHSAIGGAPDLTEAKTPGFFSFLNFIYTITEYFEFATRLVGADVYSEEIDIAIELHNVRGFVLTSDDHDWFFERIMRCTSSDLEYSRSSLPSDLVSSAGPLAIDTICWFLERFGWTKPPRSQVQDIHDRFIARRM